MMNTTMGTMLTDEVVPRLRANVRSVSAVGHEDAEELLADMTANAAKMMVSAEQSGRRFTPVHSGSCQLWVENASKPLIIPRRSLHRRASVAGGRHAPGERPAGRASTSVLALSSILPIVRLALSVGLENQYI